MSVKIPAVDPNTRALNFTSVSAIAKFDVSEYGGCERRWWFRYVDGQPEPFHAHQKLGVEIHAQIEHYLKTGEDVLGAVARAGKKYLPPPVSTGAKLLVEWGLNDKPKPPPVEGREISWYPPEESLLDADGVKIIGFFDWLHDAGGVIEVGDNKTTVDLMWAKAGKDLIKTVQMAGYAEWARRKFPSAEFIQVSHVYFQTRGQKDACKPTEMIPVETVAERWYQVEAVVRRMREVAKCEDSSEVAGNTNSCSAYKGCPFQRNCFKSPIARMKMGLLSTVSRMAENAAPAKPAEVAPKAEAAPAVEKPAEPRAPIPPPPVPKAKKLVIPKVDAPEPKPSAPKVEAKPEPAPAPKVEEKPEPSPSPKAEAKVFPPAAPKQKRDAHKAAAPQAAEQFMLCVNCVPNGPHAMLDGYIAKLVSEAQEQFNVVDVRVVSDKNSPLAYGGWRGVLAAAVKADPPKNGTWVAFTKGSEIAEVVVEALAGLCTPGALIRGF